MKQRVWILFAILFLAPVRPAYAIVSLLDRGVYQSGPNLDFQLSVTPLEATAFRGQSLAEYHVTVTSVGNFSSTVTFRLSRGLPTDGIGMISHNPVTPAPGLPAVSELTIMTTAGTPIGTYNITLEGSSSNPSITHSITLTLTVVPSTHDFTLNTSQGNTSLTVDLGQCRNTTVSVHALGSFNSTVSIFLAQTPPPYLTAQFTPNIITPPMGGVADSNLQICVGPQANPGNYNVTVMANANDPGGTISHSVNILLIVSQPPSSRPHSSIALAIAMWLGAAALVIVAVAIYLAFPSRKLHGIR